MSTELIKQSAIPITFNYFDSEQFATMQRICSMLASSDLVPEIYRVSEKTTKEKAIANCMIAVETAQRIGASPLLVMQNLYIVEGKPGWSAKFLTATVNACGRFSPMRYRITSLGTLKDVEYTEYVWSQEAKKKVPQKTKLAGPIDNLECIAYTTERGSDEVLESVPVTVEMAIKEGWYTKKGSKWPVMTKLMLQYRAVTYWTSAYAPEISMGMKTREELEDIEEIEYEDVTSQVKEEIKTRANSKEMSMDDTPAANSSPEGADGSTENPSPKEGPGF